MEEKGKRKRGKSNLAYDNYFTFFKYCNTKEFAKCPPCLKLNELNEFKDKLELFYCDTEKIEPDTEDQKKDLEDRKSKIKAASKLYGKLLNIYTAQYNKLAEDQKKTINVLNRPENLTLGFTEVDLPPLESDEEVKLEPEETIAEKVKLNPRKRKNEGIINEIRQIMYHLYQHNKITKKVYNNLIKSL